MQKDLLIIIPAYNEAENIGPVLDQLEQPEIADIADVLIMNDASTDGTNRIAKERKHTVVTHVYHLGYGSGLQAGYKYAVRRSYKYVIQMDADGQHDVCNIPVLFERLKTVDAEGQCPDIVLGSRFLEGSSAYPLNFFKKAAFVLLRLLIKYAAGHKITDPTTGLQGLNRRAVLFYSSYGHFDDQYPDANMIMQMLLLGYRIAEVPAVMHPRTNGTSMHSGLKPMLYMFRMMFSVIAVWLRIRVYKADVGGIDEKSI